ncbi:Arc family DNA-binding protein [Bradyrhizobium barranii]
MAKNNQREPGQPVQVMLRLPAEMRDRLATLAQANGRSMNAEIVGALEQHLKGLDRLSAVEAFIGQHRDEILSIGKFEQRIGDLEVLVRTLSDHTVSSLLRDPEFIRRLKSE